MASLGLRIADVRRFRPRNRSLWSNPTTKSDILADFGLKMAHLARSAAQNHSFWSLLARKTAILAHPGPKIHHCGSFWSILSPNGTPTMVLTVERMVQNGSTLVPSSPASWTLSVDPKSASDLPPKWPFLDPPQIHHTVGEVHFFERNRWTPPPGTIRI